MNISRNILSSIKASVYIFLFTYLIRAQEVQAQIREWNDIDGSGPLAPDAPGNTCLVGGVPTLKCLDVVVANLLFMSNALILLVIFVMFVIGSFKWLTSLGNPDKVGEAQGTFKWAVIGLVVYVSAYLMLRIIDILLLGGKGTIFNFSIGG